MLKDVEDSKRLSSKIISGSTSSVPTEVLIISSNYWPNSSLEKTEKETFPLHPRVFSLLSSFQETYQDLKKPRILTFLPHLGSLLLELSFEDGSERNIQASPLHATILFHLQDASPHPLTLLTFSRLLEADSSSFLPSIQFWVSRGIVKRVSLRHEDPMMRSSDGEDEVGFAINEEQGSNPIPHLSIEGEEEEEDEVEGAPRAEGQQKEREMLEVYVKGMLTNHSKMSLERMHSTLRMLSGGSGSEGASGGVRYTMTQQELEKYLNSLIAREKIELLEGMYMLKTATIS